MKSNLKWDKFNNPTLYITIEPDTCIVNPFIIYNSFGIFYLPIVHYLLIANKQTEPHKQV